MMVTTGHGLVLARCAIGRAASMLRRAQRSAVTNQARIPSRARRGRMMLNDRQANSRVRCALADWPKAYGSGVPQEMNKASCALARTQAGQVEHGR